MPTIRGTGSLFLRNLLSPPYELVPLQGAPVKHSLVFDHLYPGHMKHFHRWIQKFDVLVMPVRNPASVAATWIKRGEKLEHFLFMWSQWAALAPFAHILPIDHPDRDQYLKKLSDAVGIPLETDWEPFNQTKVPRGTSDVSGYNLDELYEIPEIRRLYVEN